MKMNMNPDSDMQELENELAKTHPDYPLIEDLLDAIHLWAAQAGYPPGDRDPTYITELLWRAEAMVTEHERSMEEEE